MKIYKTQGEIEADIKDNVLSIKGDVKFECSFSIEAKIIIEAGNIEAGNIKAGDISFYAVCFAYFSFSCKSIIGQRNNSKYFCLDSEVVIKRDK